MLTFRQFLFEHLKNQIKKGELNKSRIKPEDVLQDIDGKDIEGIWRTFVINRRKERVFIDTNGTIRTGTYKNHNLIDFRSCYEVNKQVNIKLGVKKSGSGEEKALINDTAGGFAEFDHGVFQQG